MSIEPREESPTHLDHDEDDDEGLHHHHHHRRRRRHGLQPPWPNPCTAISCYISMLKDCSKRKDAVRAREIQSHLLPKNRRRAACAGSVPFFLADYLVMTLAKCGAIQEAWELAAAAAAGGAPLTVFSWTALISAFAEAGHGHEALRAFDCMQREGVPPDKFTFVGLLKACGAMASLCHGKLLHAHVLGDPSLPSNAFIGNTIVSMYGRCGAVEDAEDAFGAMPIRDAVSWNGMLSAYVEGAQHGKALRLYRQMREEGMLQPDEATFVILFQACGLLVEAQEEGGEDASPGSESLVSSRGIGKIGVGLHSDALRLNLTTNTLVGTAIVCMYGKCKAIPEAEAVFARLVHRDTVAWNAMLSAYIKTEREERALCLYGRMLQQGGSPDQLTFVIVLQACGILGERRGAFQRGHAGLCLDVGRALHSDIKRKGFASHVPIANTLMSMYGKCGSLRDAEDVFHGLEDRDTVSWNSMLSACNEQGQGDQTLCLYSRMRQRCVASNEITLMSVLQACSERGSLAICERVHFDVVANSLDGIPPLVATLIAAYGNCARTADADSVFHQCVDSTFVTWNSCIAGHAGDCDSHASLHMFERSKLAGLTPDSIAFTSVLSGCSHNSLVVEGIECFASMSADERERTHYNIMIDLLGRAGDFGKIESLLRRMPMQPDVTIWLCILGACSTHGNLELAETAFENALRLHPEQSTAYVLMSNIYVDFAGDVEL